MPKITITLEYDDGTSKSHTAVIPAMTNAYLDQMVNEAALQAGYNPIVPLEKVIEKIVEEIVRDEEGNETTVKKTVEETIIEDGPNPKTGFRYLCGWLFKVMAKLVQSRRVDQNAEAARKAAAAEIETLQSSVKVE